MSKYLTYTTLIASLVLQYFFSFSKLRQQAMHAQYQTSEPVIVALIYSQFPEKSLPS